MAWTGEGFACTRREIDPTVAEARADDAAYARDLELFGQCDHRATYPMGPRWSHCIDCGEQWERAGR